ncbi:MAG: hypothetical protein FJZ87_04225 [Chloroflexi bacterium]|nr:hypothetical protein [Chloroflexota bacterium]
MQPEDSFGVRVGMFFMVMGAGAFILFVVSDLAKNPDFDYLFGALILIAIGWSMWRRKPPPPPSGRFSSLRKLSQNARFKRKASEKPIDGKKNE